MKAMVAAALALGLGGCMSITVREEAVSAAAAPAPAHDGVLLKRGALVVSSMERSIALYRDVLGYQVNSLTQSGPDSYSYEVFNLPRDKPIRFATLNSGAAQQRSLALIESPGVRHPAGGPRPAALVLNANGRLDAILASVRAMGLTVIPERELRSATQGVGREVAVIDPDGHLLVLYQFPQADPPSRF